MTVNEVIEDIMSCPRPHHFRFLSAVLALPLTLCALIAFNTDTAPAQQPPSNGGIDPELGKAGVSSWPSGVPRAGGSSLPAASAAQKAQNNENPPAPPTAKFTYFYINGINTPRVNDDWRGSCQSEHDTVGINLIGDPSVIDPKVPRAQSSQSIKVANESDQMSDLTCNPSGRDPWADGWIQQNCSANAAGVVKLACDMLDQINDVRAGGNTGLSPGDVLQCAQQSINLPPWMPRPLGFDIAATAIDPVVLGIVKAIIAIYKEEKTSASGAKHYFIVVGHSQGNFFAEGVAYNLQHYSAPRGRRFSPTASASCLSGRRRITKLFSPVIRPARLFPARIVTIRGPTTRSIS